jgi:hypothetical protein
MPRVKTLSPLTIDGPLRADSGLCLGRLTMSGVDVKHPLRIAALHASIGREARLSGSPLETTRVGAIAGTSIGEHERPSPTI